MAHKSRGESCPFMDTTFLESVHALVNTAQATCELAKSINRICCHHRDSNTSYVRFDLASTIKEPPEPISQSRAHNSGTLLPRATQTGDQHPSQPSHSYGILKISRTDITTSHPIIKTSIITLHLCSLPTPQNYHPTKTRNHSCEEEPPSPSTNTLRPRCRNLPQAHRP